MNGERIRAMANTDDVLKAAEDYVDMCGLKNRLGGKYAFTFGAGWVLQVLQSTPASEVPYMLEVLQRSHAGAARVLGQESDRRPEKPSRGFFATLFGGGS